MVASFARKNSKVLPLCTNLPIRQAVFTFPSLMEKLSELSKQRRSYAKTTYFLALMAYRSTPVVPTGESPSKLLMGRHINTRLPTLEKNLKPQWPDLAKVSVTDQKVKAAATTITVTTMLAHFPSYKRVMLLEWNLMQRRNGDKQVLSQQHTTPQGHMLFKPLMAGTEGTANTSKRCHLRVRDTQWQGSRLNYLQQVQFRHHQLLLIVYHPHLWLYQQPEHPAIHLQTCQLLGVVESLLSQCAIASDSALTFCEITETWSAI